jgi:CBS domain-containing protein
MEIELIEIRDFLAARHPFDALPREALDNLPKILSVRYLRRGTPFPPPDAERRDLYVLRTGAAELRDRRGMLIAKLGEGDVFAREPGADPEAQMHGATAEDTLLYVLPADRFEALCVDHPQFRRHFDATVSERLRTAVSALPQMANGRGGLMAINVGALLRKRPIAVTPGTSIREAAELMTRERVSSLLVIQEAELVGIVTDRDLRSRVVATGAPGDQPVADIMTSGVHTVPPATPGFQALVTMTRLNVHHLPVADHGTVLGLVSVSDLIRHESVNPVYLVGDVHKAASPAELAQISGKLAELQLQLALSGATATHVGQAVSAVTDAITARLLVLAEARLGAAPVPYAWVAGGSQARREQTSHSDQDNALILADAARVDDDEYFEALARFVNDGLNACGFTYCPGEVMASNPKWRQPARQWGEYFDRWIRQPEPMALMLSSVFFDLRVIHGEGALLARLQEENLRKSRDNSIFLAHMVANALTHRPPLGFFRHFVLVSGGEHDKTLDLKLRGVVPVVDLARVYALAEGLDQVNTMERLRAAAGSAAVSRDGARNLEDALEFIGTLRLRHQARQIQAGQPADNFLPPGEISALERSQLKDAFAVVSSMQQVLEQRYPLGRIV